MLRLMTTEIPGRMKLVGCDPVPRYARQWLLALAIVARPTGVWSGESHPPDQPRAPAATAQLSTGPRPPPTANRPSRKEGYAGLRLTQSPRGVVVARVLPGPVAGTGDISTTIGPGDLIVSMNGRSLDVAGYVALVRSLAPGETLQIAYRPKSGGDVRTIDVVLDDRARWSGTIGDGLAPGRVVPRPEPGDTEALLLAESDALDLRHGLDALLAALNTKQDALLAPDTPALVVQALRRPLSFDRAEAAFAARVRPLGAPRPLVPTLLTIHRLILDALALPDVQARPDLSGELQAARHQYGPLAAKLLTTLRDQLSFPDTNLPSYLRLARAGSDIAASAVALLPTIARRSAELERVAREALAIPRPIPRALVTRLRGLVDGPILAAKLVDGGLWVVGGDGPNRYEMDRLAAVFDIGGADLYSFSRPFQGTYRIIIDAAGDDTYLGTGDLAGPAGGTFSVDVIDDRAGDDHYSSTGQGSIAAALFGIAVLIDEAGDDQYLNETRDAGWSQGAALYGAALLLDRKGNDRYRAQVFAQGVGGPGGLGLLIDASGNDTYVANGPEFPSVYNTPAVFAGFSQGFGVGVRGYAAGGLGALYDLSGADRYIVGELGQGTSYYQGAGILHDVTGNDIYIGSRYAQGSAAHQAAGILIDEAGNDAYVCPGPAGQGAAWDQSVAMLVDEGGDDVYQGSTLAQGAAAQEAVGVLLDLGGQDHYECTESCLGQSGDNAYHYQTDRVFSFSAMVDRGGSVDAYPAPRTNSKLMRTGSVDEAQPAQSHCCGLFLDD